MAWFGPSRCTGGNLLIPSDRANGIKAYLCSCPNLIVLVHLLLTNFCVSLPPNQFSILNFHNAYKHHINFIFTFALSIEIFGLSVHLFFSFSTFLTFYIHPSSTVRALKVEVQEICIYIYI